MNDDSEYATSKRRRRRRPTLKLQTAFCTPFSTPPRTRTCLLCLSFCWSVCARACTKEIKYLWILLVSVAGVTLQGGAGAICQLMSRKGRMTSALDAWGGELGAGCDVNWLIDVPRSRSTISRRSAISRMNKGKWKRHCALELRRKESDGKSRRIWEPRLREASPAWVAGEQREWSTGNFAAPVFF
jgi:hypothetical protein